MARHLLGAAVAVLSCVAPGFASVHRTEMVVAMAMTADCAQNDKALAIARAEASRVWSGTGVRLQWVPMSDLPHRSPLSEWLVVQCLAGAPREESSPVERIMPIASIRFINSQPMNTVTLSLRNANALLDDDDREDRMLNERFPLLRKARLGRMIGRAIAHEVGHFLSQSQAHTPSGLMRATHTVAALTGLGLGPFSVDGSYARRLEMTRASTGETGNRDPRAPIQSQY
jgi:hypothetical protein